MRVNVKTSKATRKSRKVQKRDGSSSPTDNLECFLNQPNINMTIPWIYEIYKSMASSRDTKRDGDDDRTEEDLQCFLNQPNINMTIPWIYSIYKSVKEGGGGGGGDDSAMRWIDET